MLLVHWHHNDTKMRAGGGGWAFLYAEVILGSSCCYGDVLSWPYSSVTPHTHSQSHLFIHFLSPSVSFSCSLPLCPDDSHPSMKSISHLGTGWHWHAGHAIWRLMAKLYYAIVTICCQQPIALSVGWVYEVCGWAYFNIWFHSLPGNFFFFSDISAWMQVLLTFTNDVSHDIKS